LTPRDLAVSAAGRESHAAYGAGQEHGIPHARVDHLPDELRSGQRYERERCGVEEVELRRKRSLSGHLRDDVLCICARH